jgi:predicted aspartyl protease
MFLKVHNLSYKKGKKINLKGIYGKSKTNLIQHIPIKIFNIETELNNVTANNLGKSNNAILIGADFFKKFIVQINYPDKEIRILTRDSLDINKYQNLKMRKQKGTGTGTGIPIVNVEFKNQINSWLILDTGNNGGLHISRNLASKLKLLNKDKEISINRRINTIGYSEKVNIEYLKFGNYILENVAVSFPTEGQRSYLESQYSKTGSRIKGKKVQGILGYDILKHFIITLDYNSGKAHISIPPFK